MLNCGCKGPSIGPEPHSPVPLHRAGFFPNAVEWLKKQVDMLFRVKQDALVEGDGVHIDEYDRISVVGKADLVGGKVPASQLPLDGYATEEWVGDQGFLTEHQDISGKADLVDGRVPADQLPSYVDDVLEFDTRSAFPEEGEAGKIYVAKDTNLTYRWGGSAYVQIGGGDFVRSVNGKDGPDVTLTGADIKTNVTSGSKSVKDDISDIRSDVGMRRLYGDLSLETWAFEGGAGRPYFSVDKSVSGAMTETQNFTLEGFFLTYNGAVWRLRNDKLGVNLTVRDGPAATRLDFGNGYVLKKVKASILDSSSITADLSAEGKAADAKAVGEALSGKVDVYSEVDKARTEFFCQMKGIYGDPDVWYNVFHLTWNDESGKWTSGGPDAEYDEETGLFKCNFFTSDPWDGSTDLYSKGDSSSRVHPVVVRNIDTGKSQDSNRLDGKTYSRIVSDIGGSITIPWTRVTSKPYTFAPSKHKHTIEDVDKLVTTLGSKVNAYKEIDKANTKFYCMAKGASGDPDAYGTVFVLEWDENTQEWGDGPNVYLNSDGLFVSNFFHHDPWDGSSDIYSEDRNTCVHPEVVSLVDADTAPNSRKLEGKTCDEIVSEIESTLLSGDGFKDAVKDLTSITRASSATKLANNRIAVVNGATGGTVSVSIDSYSGGFRRCQLLVTDVASDNAVTIGMPAGTYKAIGVITTSKGDNLYTFQEYDTGKWLVMKEGVAAGGGGTSDKFFIGADGDLATSEDKLNKDGTVTVDGTLNADGTYTVNV